jgi:uncharacterized hydrophobic protein (TIGR00271 family)
MSEAQAPGRGWLTPLGLLRRLRHLFRQARADVDQQAVLSHLREDGGLSVRFGVLTLLSCAIAILGLLLSSPAVVIGAMLISPLMTPIMLFGFSLATLNHHLVKRSLKAIAVGTLLAIAQSAAIVWLSPLKTATPEILARTQPNFFDLLVAIFSAIAGAYAVSQRKGETIVGVAIATALMPPLAVIGYGIATLNWPIFSGAGGLFMTNLLAIGLTASVVAKVFGFGAHNAAETNYWHAAGILVVFAVLSIPLGLSLKEIAGQAVTTAKARAALAQYFASQSAHLYGVTVSFPNGRPVEVEALALVQNPHPGAEAQLQSLLRRKLGMPVALSLSQMPIEQHESLDRQAVDDLVRRATEAQALKLAAATQPKPPSMTETATAKTGLSPLQISEDSAAKKLMLRADERDPDRLSALRAAVEGLARDHPQWSIAVRPEPMALPRLMFAEKSAIPDAASAQTLQNIIWALKSAAAASAQVTGYSDSSGTPTANRRMAMKRAEAVANALSAAGIAAKPEAVFPVPDQAGMERELGRALFRRVDVIPQWMEAAQGSTPQAAAPKPSDARLSSQ